MQSDPGDDLNLRRTVGPEGGCLRHAHRARGMIGLTLVVILTAMQPSPAGAQLLGNFCWSLNPFVDTLRLNFSKGGLAFSELHGRWLATASVGQQAAGGAGPATYQLLGAGTATTSTMLPTSIELGFHAVHNTRFFGGNQGCNLYAVIDNLTLNGSWTLQCPGPTPYTAQGPLILVFPCPNNF